jgi:uncharacterized protein YehS (DUF1456 family)
MINIFSQSDVTMNRAQISDLLKKEEDPDQQICEDPVMASFLNGLINEKRGKKEGAQPEPEEVLNNNIIFMKLKIALNLRAEDVIRIMELADFVISKPELSAFFRKAGHKHYRVCKDQILRNFLQGVHIAMALKQSRAQSGNSSSRPQQYRHSSHHRQNHSSLCGYSTIRQPDQMKAPNIPENS